MNVWAEPEQQHYRYTVKCDRERFLAIEKAAKAQGLSATQLVQVHFEGILDGAAATAEEPRRKGDQPEREEVETAARYRLTVGALRVHRVIEASMDEFGRAEIGVGTIAKRTGLTEGSVRVMITRLVGAGHLRRRSGGGWRRTTVYQVVPLDRQRKGASAAHEGAHT